MFDGELRTYGIDDPEIEALRARMAPSVFALVEHLLGHWQQAGMPIRPAGRGFALQAPFGDRLTTIAWIYPASRRHPEARIEVALKLLERRAIPAEHIAALHDDLTRFPTFIPDESTSMVALAVREELTREDMERLARVLVHFGHSLG